MYTNCSAFVRMHLFGHEGFVVVYECCSKHCLLLVRETSTTVHFNIFCENRHVTCFNPADMLV